MTGTAWAWIIGLGCWSIFATSQWLRYGLMEEQDTGQSYVRGYHAGRKACYSEMVDVAIRTGHAEYYLDIDNQRQWRWKTNKSKNENDDANSG